MTYRNGKFIQILSNQGSIYALDADGNVWRYNPEPMVRADTPTKQFHWSLLGVERDSTNE